jgi:hypothetical protein
MKIKSILTLLLAAAFIVPIIGNVSAQEEGGGNGLSISPTKNELVIDRGKSETVNIQVKNVSNTDILAKAYVNDFEADGNTGNPKLIVDDSIQSANSIKEFVSGVEDVLVPAGEARNVAVFIQIPEQASPGAYYGAVRFLATNPSKADSDEAQVSLNASVASLILVEVPGDLVQRIEVSNLSAYIDDKDGFFFTKAPNKIGTEITNLGNSFARPFGKVVVNGPFGQGQVYEYELNSTSPRGNVLPESSRLFLDNLEGVSRPGKYSIVANISYGNGGEILEATATFWYIPIWFLAVVIGLIVLIVGGAFYLYRKYVTKSTKRKK